MARKPKEAEHENLERWMVSYADFMTLLFATFVVLYALAQLDIKEFHQLEDSIKVAFNGGITDGGQDVMDGIGKSILNGSDPKNDSVIPPIMEYLSQKYENNSMEAIKEEINKEVKSGELEGVAVDMTDRGLVITLKNANAFFASGSATLTPEAKKVVGSIGQLIKSKFNNHLIRIEGHTDNINLSSGAAYPSNWELSAARSASVARYLISNYKITSNLFTIVGYGDTKPLADNKTPAGREKNRRIEIVLLKNQVAKYEPMGNETISPQNVIKQKTQSQGNLSDAAQQLLIEDNNKNADNVIILDEYANPDNDKIKKALNDFEHNKKENSNKMTRTFKHNSETDSK